MVKNRIYVQRHNIGIAAPEPIVCSPIGGDPSHDRVVDVQVAASVADTDRVDDALIDSEVYIHRDDLRIRSLLMPYHGPFR